MDSLLIAIWISHSVLGSHHWLASYSHPTSHSCFCCNIFGSNVTAVLSGESEMGWFCRVVELHWGYLVVPSWNNVDLLKIWRNICLTKSLCLMKKKVADWNTFYQLLEVVLCQVVSSWCCTLNKCSSNIACNFLDILCQENLVVNILLYKQCIKCTDCSGRYLVFIFLSFKSLIFKLGSFLMLF